MRDTGRDETPNFTGMRDPRPAVGRTAGGIKSYLRILVSVCTEEK